MAAASTLDPRGGVAVITGAASGSGAALALQGAACGVIVSSHERRKQTACRLPASGFRLPAMAPEDAAARDIARRAARLAPSDRAAPGAAT